MIKSMKQPVQTILLAGGHHQLSVQTMGALQKS
jgi:hypothetical protein